MATRKWRICPPHVDVLERRLLLFAGQLDVSFGDLGTATRSLDAPIVAQATAAAPLPGGKFLVAGIDDESYDGGPLLARYLSNGQLDATFGTGGRVDLSSATIFGNGVPVNGDVKAVLVQNSGRI